MLDLGASVLSDVLDSIDERRQVPERPKGYPRPPEPGSQV